MRVICRNGHFAFYPKDENEIFLFSTFFEETLVRESDFYTFSFLKDAPKYALKGKAFLGLTAVKTYSGEVWEVMKENGFVYNLATKALVLKSAVTTAIDPQVSEGFFLAESPLIQPGSRISTGQQLLSYDAEYDCNTSQLKVFEVQYG